MKLIEIIHAEALRVKSKYHVTLTEEERVTVRKLVTTGRAAARARKHAEVLLAADASAGGPAMTDVEIGAKYDVGQTTIARVRQRFVDEGLAAALRPRPHANDHARKVDGAAEAHLIAVACSSPPAGHARWTLRLLADALVHLDTGIDISHETVRRVLKKKPAQAVAAEGMVHPTRREWRVCVPHGRRARGVSPAV